ncbi:MAG: S-layer homology domain-containing protein, partial [Tissierellia bacterium]|nr:S-layer homology domain-containing protein [Tissierellia bacterium]
DLPKEHWAYKEIAVATKSGWIKGYSDGSFKPDNPTTRAEAISIINRAFNRGISENSKLPEIKEFVDNVKGQWYYYEIIEATNNHECTGERPLENWIKVY